MESLCSSSSSPGPVSSSAGSTAATNATCGVVVASASSVPTPVYDQVTSVAGPTADYMVQYGAPAPLVPPQGYGDTGQPPYATEPPYSTETHVLNCYPCPPYAEVGPSDMIQPFVPIDAYHTAYLQEARHSLGPNGKPKRKRVATMAQRRAANIRERRRMFNLNEAFDDLRKRVPTFAYEKRLSRIETLRLAIAYISFMADLVKGKEPHEIRLAGIRSPGWAGGARGQDCPPSDSHEHYGIVYTDNSTSASWADDSRSRRQEPEDDDTNSSTVST